MANKINAEERKHGDQLVEATAGMRNQGARSEVDAADMEQPKEALRCY